MSIKDAESVKSEDFEIVARSRKKYYAFTMREVSFGQIVYKTALKTRTLTDSACSPI